MAKLPSWKTHLPNALTILRGVLTGVMVFLFYVPVPYQFVWIFACFVVASASDFFDGYLSRRWGVVSVFGTVFDSLFDKILVLTLFLLLIPYDLVHPVVYVLLFMREMVVDSLKNYLLAQNAPVSANIWGKWKMVFQILMLGALLLRLMLPDMPFLKEISWGFAGLALCFSFVSGYIYACDFVSFCKKHR